MFYINMESEKKNVARESHKVKGHIIIDQERCKGCCLCMAFCPRGSIVIAKRLNIKGYFPADFVDKQECTGCATCALMCPEAAIEVYRDEKADERK